MHGVGQELTEKRNIVTNVDNKKGALDCYFMILLASYPSLVRRQLFIGRQIAGYGSVHGQSRRIQVYGSVESNCKRLWLSRAYDKIG